jgi:hypothetical protein
MFGFQDERVRCLAVICTTSACRSWSAPADFKIADDFGANEKNASRVKDPQQEEYESRERSVDRAVLSCRRDDV